MSNNISIDLYNRQPVRLELCLEPFGHGVEMQAGMEYRIVSVETEYRIEFGPDLIIVYLEDVFEYKIFERPYSTDFQNPGDWQLVVEY
ncbi:hypothetical protein D0N36_11095 [Hymenobacter lapidiphilus]|nr:hypothetical protein D0N36_11095 [Hymenobacter sp. CCM 8763]